MAINKDTIVSIIPKHTLVNLGDKKLDIDNDIDYLIDWLQPYFPDLQQPLLSSSKITNGGIKEIGAKMRELAVRMKEPSQRVRAAIRSCLKDECNQYEFIKLYNNSIGDQFNQFFNGKNLSNYQFFDYINMIKLILAYYNHQISYLNLNKLSLDLFQRNLNSLFYANVVQHNNDFSIGLQNFLSNHLFIQLVNPMITKINVIEVIKTLVSIGLTNHLNSVLINISIDKIIQFIKANCAMIWNKSLFPLINQFVNQEIYPNFAIVLTYSNETNLYNDANDVYLHELLKIAHDELVSLRIQEIYDIVYNFPDSIESLNELYQCFQIKFNHQNYNGDHDFSNGNINNSILSDVSNLSKFAYLADSSIKSQAYQREKLVDTFINHCSQNLLHSGANTIEVINMYNKTIKAFLIIDPKGVLLDKVVRQIREYLKTRDDVIVKLVHGLLDNDANTNELIELAIELRNCGDYNSNKMLEDTAGLDWVPDPIDALPDFKKGKVSDIIESFISIFDSKEVFINEFTKLFGDRLMNIHNYDVEEIQDYVNLLKLRFGANEFSTLDVMIKDISESENINLSINNGKVFSFHSSVLSHNYWQTALDKINDMDQFKVPEQVQKHFKEYSHGFSKYKRGRKLRLIPSMGLVKLNLRFDNNKIRHYEVSPDKASVIMLFNGENNLELSINQISTTLSMNEYTASQVLRYWVKEGVLIESSIGKFKTNEEIEGDEHIDHNSGTSMVTEATAQASTIKNNTNIGYDKVLWPYLLSIFENFNSITLARVRELLSITVPKDRVDFSGMEGNFLEGYLDWLLQEKKLEIVDGLYRLKVDH